MTLPNPFSSSSINYPSMILNCIIALPIPCGYSYYLLIYPEYTKLSSCNFLLLYTLFMIGFKFWTFKSLFSTRCSIPSFISFLILSDPCYLCKLIRRLSIWIESILFNFNSDDISFYNWLILSAKILSCSILKSFINYSILSISLFDVLPFCY